ncbi:hypothetical protein [Pseudoduganella namucuonensis]|uniref:hypothetical protein n=1 Tax=Pseudoduganella namucuonensis TaxID=1035707 RepID=UPI000B87050F|nr:hypothetical protein [Pseudoduganella namucuonensis]
MDDVFAKWFDDSTVIVRRSPELDGFMTDDQIARIVGAPRDSSIVVSADDGAIAFKVDNKIFSEPMFRWGYPGGVPCRNGFVVPQLQ